MPTYIERLVAMLAGMGDRPCLRHGDRDVHASALLARIHRLARALDALHVGRGDLVAIFASNHPDALALRYAANLVGAAATFLSDAGTPDTRAQLVRTLEPKLLVVLPATAHLAPPDTAATLAGLGVTPAGGFDLQAAAAAQPDDAFACRARPDDLAVIVSSGGSTGVPKGSWRTFATYGAMVSVPSPPDRRQLVNGPLAYLSQVLVDMTLLGGGTVVLRERYDPVDTAATIEAEGITDLFLVEPQLFELMDHPRLASADLSSLRTLSHIGASAPPTLRRRAHERFGPRVVHTYGASEMGLVSLSSAAEDDTVSAGHLLPSVALRLRRADGTLASDGETGSIEVRSPALAQGYRHRPDLEAAAFEGGWYRSGDLGRLMEDGRLQVFGRAVDIDLVDGRMVSPTLIEDGLLQRLPVLRYVSVVRDGDGWIALLLSRPGQRVEAGDCIAAIAEAHGASVAGAVRLCFGESVPLTPQGKPDREAIRSIGALGRAIPG